MQLESQQKMMEFNAATSEQASQRAKELQKMKDESAYQRELMNSRTQLKTTEINALKDKQNV